MLWLADACRRVTNSLYRLNQWVLYKPQLEFAPVNSMRRTLNPSYLIVLLTLFWCGVWPAEAQTTIFRDRAAFNAASQNLHTVDFDSVTPLSLELNREVDGVFFESIGGMDISNGANGNHMLMGFTVGEITRLTIYLPPGTTAVGCDQFVAPMIVSTSTGVSVTMNQSDGSTFVGFVSDEPIATLIISLDFPEPTPTAIVDNLSFGQRRAGNEPPAPQLLVSTVTGRSVALDSVTKEGEPFHVTSSHNLSTDNHTRVTLFVVGVLLTAADKPFVTVKAEDAQQHVFDLPCEATERVQNVGWMSQVTVRLPDALIGVGDVNVSVTVRGVTSNKASLRVE